MRVNDCSRRRRRRPPPRRLLGDCCCVYLDDYRHQQTVLSLSVSVSVCVSQKGVLRLSKRWTRLSTHTHTRRHADGRTGEKKKVEMDASLLEAATETERRRLHYLLTFTLTSSVLLLLLITWAIVDPCPHVCAVCVCSFSFPVRPSVPSSSYFFTSSCYMT